MKYEIDKNINSSGEILGLPRTSFYFFVLLTVIVILSAFSKITFFKFCVAVAAEGVIYLVLYVLSKFDFIGMFSNEKMPDIIINNALEDENTNE